MLQATRRPLESACEPEEPQVPFDFAQGRLSTALRSGRDDNSAGK
jgi:hypothetical protein